MVRVGEGIEGVVREGSTRDAQNGRGKGMYGIRACVVSEMSSGDVECDCDEECEAA